MQAITYLAEGEGDEGGRGGGGRGHEVGEVNNRNVKETEVRNIHGDRKCSRGRL